MLFTIIFNPVDSDQYTLTNASIKTFKVFELLDQPPTNKKQLSTI